MLACGLAAIYIHLLTVKESFSCHNAVTQPVLGTGGRRNLSSTSKERADTATSCRALALAPVQCSIDSCRILQIDCRFESNRFDFSLRGNGLSPMQWLVSKGTA